MSEVHSVLTSFGGNYSREGLKGHYSEAALESGALALMAGSKLFVDINPLDEHGDGVPAEDLQPSDTVVHCFEGLDAEGKPIETLTFNGAQATPIEPDGQGWQLGGQGVRLMAADRGLYTVLHWVGHGSGIVPAEFYVEVKGVKGRVHKIAKAD